MVRTLAMVLLVLAAEFQSANLVKSPCIISPLLSDNPPTTCELVMDEVQVSSLKIIPINNETEFDTVVDFVSRVFSRNQRNITGSEVIGIVGDLDLKTASIIHTLSSRANLSITLVSAVAPSTFLPTTNLVLPNLLHMNPLMHYVEALVAFFDHLNWTRIGLISDDTYYYEFAAELVQQKLLENSELRIVPFVRISESDNRTKTIQTFKEYETDVIVISTSDKVACSLIQEARKIGFMWPEYAWILFDIRFHSSLATCQEEGVILLRDQSILEESSLYHVRCSYREMDKFLNSGIFLNSITLAAINASDLGVNGKVKFREGKRLNNISIAKLDKSKFREVIAFYVTESHRMSILDSFIVNVKPRGTILKRYFRDQNFTLRIILVTLLFLLLFAFVSIVLILYIYFRKEPEIKATSVTVSLCMFLACYILLAYLPLLVADSTASFTCDLIVWFSLAGISVPLITATLFAKMLRVYLIFFDPVSYKKKLFLIHFFSCIFCFLCLQASLL